ncbi:MAG TPA: ABC transporter permease subunit [Saprospiraceae bacterium]|nr:ABC transporter permease subunit [Saprospiraceae bacterium]HPI08236.1 ABC transporter permease subunit [Saprospiraceae bacterium]
MKSPASSLHTFLRLTTVGETAPAAPVSVNPVFRVVKYVLFDILQNRIVIGYTVFLLAVSMGLFGLSDDPTKGLISLLNIVLIVTPLVSSVFATIHFYNSYEFIELLAAQPVRRDIIVWSQFLGLVLALLAAVWIGIGIPIAIYSATSTGLVLLVAASGLTVVFIALALLASVCTRDKAKGIGLALLLWFYFTLLYDAMVLFIMFSFADYPLEKATLVMAALNPIDLARVIVLLQMDISALMGYTGALFREWLGSSAGIATAVGILLLWATLPMLLAVRIFRKKDL